MPIFLYFTLVANTELQLDLIKTIIACMIVSLAIFILKGLLILLFKGIVFFRILAWFISVILVVYIFYESFSKFSRFEPPNW
jgi:hypothetical protein